MYGKQTVEKGRYMVSNCSIDIDILAHIDVKLDLEFYNIFTHIHPLYC